MRRNWGYIQDFDMEEFISKHGFKREEVIATPTSIVSCFLPSDNNVVSEGAMVEIVKEGF